MNDVMVSIRDLHHTYLADTPLAAPALHGAELTLRRGSGRVGGAGRRGQVDPGAFHQRPVAPHHGRMRDGSRTRYGLVTCRPL